MQTLDVDLIVFDLDGTLIDSAVDIAESLNLTFSDVGYDPLPIETIRQFVGNGVLPLVKRAVEMAGHPDRLEAILDKFREIYQERLLINTRLFDGVKDTLDTLQKDFALALITNKPARFTFPILDGLKLSPYFGGAVVAGDTLDVNKPAKETMERIWAVIDKPIEKTVIVGDSEVDIKTGKNAGVYTIGVTYGFRNVDELANADILIDRFSDLLDCVKGASNNYFRSKNE